MSAVLLSFASVWVPCAASGQGAAEPFVVHEWGTFTSFAGSDGVCLEYRPLAYDDLPAFVYDRARQAGLAGGEDRKSALVARQRMETPVTYFYTDRPRVVDVTVRFPRGLFTEFYPPVTRMEPAYDPEAVEPCEDGLLRWRRSGLIPCSASVHAGSMPEKVPQEPALPAVEGGNPYASARQTDSAIVQADDPFDASRKHVEKFLFYRGVGDFDLPLSVRSLGDDRFALTNSGPQPIRSLFLVHNDGGGLRVATLDRLAKEDRLTLPQARTTTDALAEAMAQTLTAEGLFPREARAMVDTWRGAWFGEEGVRLLYGLPASLVDEIIPLHIEPTPDRVIRVLVGRMELLTPETERRIEELAAKLAASPEERQAALAALAHFGRFAEPALRRAISGSSDAELRRQAAELLERAAFPH